MLSGAGIEAAGFVLGVAVAVVCGLLAGSAAAHNGRRRWVWIPIGALFPLTPAATVHALEAIPFIDTTWTPSQWFIASAACAAWSGYIAWTKERRAWLWGVLGAVFLYIPLVIVAFMPGMRESSSGRDVSPPKGVHPDSWLAGDASQRRIARRSADLGRSVRDRTHDGFRGLG